MAKTTRLVTESSLSQKCFKQLQDDIVYGVLAPREKLKIEPLAERLGTGATPVREALSGLAVAGLVVAEENKGFRVAEISQADMRDTYEIFTAVECMALELSIQRGDANWQAGVVAELYKIGLLEKEYQPEMYDAWVEQNYNFHVALIAGCNSPTLLAIRKNLYIKFDRYCRMADSLLDEPVVFNHTEHEALAAAVLAKDVHSAKALLVEHNMSSLDDSLAIFKHHNFM